MCIEHDLQAYHRYLAGANLMLHVHITETWQTSCAFVHLHCNICIAPFCLVWPVYQWIPSKHIIGWDPSSPPPPHLCTDVCSPVVQKVQAVSVTTLMVLSSEVGARNFPTVLCTSPLVLHFIAVRLNPSPNASRNVKVGWPHALLDSYSSSRGSSVVQRRT